MSDTAKNGLSRYITAKDVKRSAIMAVWFMFLTFPIMVIKVNTVTDTVEWRWFNMLIIGVASFILSHVWKLMIDRREGRMADAVSSSVIVEKKTLRDRMEEKPMIKKVGSLVILVIAVLFPIVTGMYQTSIMITALLYVVLALGLNIIVGLGGLLVLGYIVFYGVGAYTYALLNYHFGLNFWLALPLGGIFAMIIGILIAIPVLRLRGDYLAIVTLAFGEIFRIVMENWNGLSFGPSGIANIPRPTLFGLDFSIQQSTTLTYYVIVIFVIITIFIVRRLEDSRLGRAWVAMREDEIAGEAMGIDMWKTKLAAFALSTFWAGVAGVIFAGKTTFINPASFTMWESILVLCMVVLGGMGSIPGVISGALIITLLPEYLRAFSELRMLIFGAVLVLVMVFKPEGMIPAIRQKYEFKGITGNKNKGDK
ncbi:MAG: branched-chain amino acid ABC transporter permease [Spirochaetales bacterium]|uniref:Branched-chain amino acid ABC transporter permease n=1 Tax=Candidatus Thalassospirochaeta sargassi TaxID=3119039 RepID=A0AAJ1I9Z2_9SPIO|nr:branched-chain amino acid ABC transporter permease [Spirochaetales bacterium]